jgi:hypothetical protein
MHGREENNMSDLRTAAQKVVDAWDTYENGTMDHPLSGVMEVLRAALAQEEPRREWQGLTDDEVDDMSLGGTDSELRKQQFARAIEAALKEKNHA